MPITKKIQIVDPKEFAKTVLDLNKEVFMVYIAIITSKKAIYLARKVPIALLKAKKALVTIPANIQNPPTIFQKNYLGYYWNILRSTPLESI